MNNHFAYSFLKYVHSLRTGESLNVAILFAFPQENIFRFVYPKNLQRLKCAYYDFNETQVRSFLKTFQQTANALTSKSPFAKGEFNRDLLNDILKEEFIAEDEGVLQFSSIRVGVKYTTDLEKIVKEIYHSYFEYYLEPQGMVLNKPEKEQNRRDEAYILAAVQALLVQEKPSLKSFHFRSGEVKTDNARLKFGFEWLNHGVHLVKPLSLDYKTGNTIEEKAHTLHSKLHILDMEGESKYNFDIVVSKPQISKLSLAYDNAISILKESSSKTRVIQEYEFQAYSKEIATNIIV